MDLPFPLAATAAAASLDPLLVASVLLPLVMAAITLLFFPVRDLTKLGMRARRPQ